VFSGVIGEVGFVFAYFIFEVIHNSDKEVLDDDSEDSI
jgi:hypothetical protein